MKRIVNSLLLLVTLLMLAACGGGGGGGGDNSQNQPPAAKTTATFKVNLTGSLPASTAISGTSFTITLPANVTPALTSNNVASGVVAPSGTFSGSTLTPQVVYTAATASAPGTLNVILANSATAGITEVGEVATITLQLANDVTPAANDFTPSKVSVIDAALYGTISNMGASVTSVTLQ